MKEATGLFNDLLKTAFLLSDYTINVDACWKGRKMRLRIEATESIRFINHQNKIIPADNLPGSVLNEGTELFVAEMNSWFERPLLF